MRMVVSYLLSALAIIGFLPAQGLPADPLDEARALIQISQTREEVILDGVDWRWRVERGRCRSVEDALSGVFDRDQPVDSYECRWLTNDGTFLYESLAQQPQRAIENDAKQQVLATTQGSEQFLATKSTRLQFDPEAFTAWQGVVENEANGLSARWGPGGTPVHGGAFGLLRISALMDYFSDPEKVVSLDRAVSLTGVDSKVVRITQKSGNGDDAAYFFAAADHALVQREVFSKGRLNSRIVVTERRSQVRESNGEQVVIPMVSVSLSEPSSDGSWTVSRITTQEVKLKRAPLSEMVIQADSPVLGLNPVGRMQKATSVKEISAENLDDVVARLFADRQEADANLKGARREGSSSRSHLPEIAFVVCVVLGILSLVVYLRARRGHSS